MIPRRQISLLPCNFAVETHRQAFARILESYMTDPMGGCEAHSTYKVNSVMDALQRHPTAYVTFAAIDMDIGGMAVCFENYSTFSAAAFINIHDLAVLPRFRRSGIATALIHGVILEGIQRRCAKVTLEVREDNVIARSLYAKSGFQSAESPMAYWSRDLSSFQQ